MVNELTVDYHPSPSALTSRVHPRSILWTLEEFISVEYFLNFFSNLLAGFNTMVMEKFQIHGVKIDHWKIHL